MIFLDFPPSNFVKLENVDPTFSSFRPLLSYSFVAATVINNFCDQHGAFQIDTNTFTGFSSTTKSAPETYQAEIFDFCYAISDCFRHAFLFFPLYYKGIVKGFPLMVYFDEKVACRSLMRQFFRSFHFCDWGFPEVSQQLLVFRATFCILILTNFYFSEESEQLLVFKLALFPCFTMFLSSRFIYFQ